MIQEAFAQAVTPISVKLTQGSGMGIAGDAKLTTIIGNVLTIITTIAVIAVLFMLLFGAFEWIISGGDKEKVANARNRITHALIGLAILGLAFVMVTVVGNIIGVNVLQDLKIPPLGQTAP